MKILVIGGTNFIGPHVVRHLCHLGYEVTVFHRGQTIAELPTNVHQIFGDRRHLKEFKSQFEEIAPQIVVDMILFTEQDAVELMNTFKGIAKRVVAISSIDVYRAYSVLLGQESEVISVPLTENSPLRQQLYPFRDMPDRPLKTPIDYEKILVEQVVMSEPTLPGTIIRLPMVYGPNDPLHRFYPYLQRIDDKRPVIVLEESLARWCGSYGYVENVAYAIALAICHEQAAGRIYHVADREALSEAERIYKIGQLTGWQGQVFVLPKEKLPTEWKLTVNTKQHWLIDSTRIREELGYKEVVSPDEALLQTIRWEQANPPKDSHQSAFPWLLDYVTEDAIQSLVSSNK
ncbi:NAD-dependent epimerase/dehydratase family protein [Scytonema sp. UIC 10036]|uniref:NAD-dependent epimerase/dehydratase family protein n=1 Tax=Scytonema sp. UIC 10036 TaxID=2304196 RepID=UPI0012DA0282|nr:NAD-dependent epimerase/dehydratase family protein [Scytonema sp. UIC 10036]MUH00670.1 NAD-dependent epimerase/dehydratase family protein [Scytonema sp. UIC 10036]